MSTHTYDVDELVPIGRAAELLHVSVATVRRWEADGHLESVRTPGNQRRYRVGDVLNLLARSA